MGAVCARIPAPKTPWRSSASLEFCTRVTGREKEGETDREQDKDQDQDQDYDYDYEQDKEHQAARRIES